MPKRGVTEEEPQSPQEQMCGVQKWWSGVFEWFSAFVSAVSVLFRTAMTARELHS